MCVLYLCCYNLTADKQKHGSGTQTTQRSTQRSQCQKSSGRKTGSQRAVTNDLPQSHEVRDDAYIYSLPLYPVLDSSEYYGIHG